MAHTLFSIIHEARSHYGHSPFASLRTDSGWVSKTFNQCFDEATYFAAFILSLGYKASDRIAIYAEGSPNWIIGEYGTIMASCIAVPLSFKLLPEEVAYRLEHSDSRAILTNANHFSQIVKIAQSLNQRTGKTIDIIVLDDFFYPLESNSGYPEEHLFQMLQIFHAGKTCLPQFSAQLLEIEASCTEETVVTISYTSGTTGNPKGIMLSHGNYYINSLDSVDIFKVPHGGYRNFIILPVDHSFAQTVGIHASIQRGIEVWFVDSRGGGLAILRNIPKNMQEAEPIFIMTVPALSGNFMKKIYSEMDKKGPLIRGLFSLGIRSGIRHLGDSSKRPKYLLPLLNGCIYYPLKWILLNKVRSTVFGKRATFMSGGGASFDLAQQRFFRALGLPLYQGYGMTEASPVIASNTAKNLKLGTSGVALPHVQIRIMKEDGTLAHPLEKGEIQVSGPNLMVGYFNNDIATQEAFIDGWLKTGDLGWLDEDGFLTVSGRAKALLISADGEKYSPEGIEDAIQGSSKLINQVVVWNDHKKYTCALITLDEGVLRKLIKEHRPRNPEVLLEIVKDSFYTFKRDSMYRNLVPLNWTPATFQIIPEAFSEQNGLVNSTMKIVRYKVVETYSALIDYIYTAQGSTYKNQRNLEVITRYLKDALVPFTENN